MTVGLPIVGLMLFDRHDQHNVYIYSRMYASQQPVIDADGNEISNAGSS